MAEADERQLDRLVEAVLGSPKYRHVSRDLVRRIGEIELGKGRGLKEGIKATRNKLHQVGGAYFEGRARYDDWLVELRVSAGEGKLREACRKVMGSHASTRERLPILDEFYAVTFADLPPIRSVLDLACGLNPLALPWMPLPPDVTYHACDMYADMVGFLNGVLELMPVNGSAGVCDVLGAIPEEEVDLALILKTIPCLEQVDKTAGARLLENVRAEHLLVSFPVQSLGGRGKGMLENYEARFLEIVGDKPWEVRKFTFQTELAFLVSK